jgi:hypothetical protein
MCIRDRITLVVLCACLGAPVFAQERSSADPLSTYIVCVTAVYQEVADLARTTAENFAEAQLACVDLREKLDKDLSARIGSKTHDVMRTIDESISAAIQHDVSVNTCPALSGPGRAPIGTQAVNVAGTKIECTRYGYGTVNWYPPVCHPVVSLRSKNGMRFDRFDTAKFAQSKGGYAKALAEIQDRLAVLRLRGTTTDEFDNLIRDALTIEEALKACGAGELAQTTTKDDTIPTETVPAPMTSAQVSGLSTHDCPVFVNVVDAKGEQVRFDVETYVRNKGSKDAALEEVRGRRSHANPQLSASYQTIERAISCR